MFSDAIADSHEAFLDLVRSGHATYYEVYSGTPSRELERLFEGATEGEVLLRFDMQAHSEAARSRFCGLTDLERNTYGLPPDLAEKPIPYFGSFVAPSGKVGIAWNSEGVAELIVRTRKEVALAGQVGHTASRGDS